jgi:serine protease Do
MNFRSNSIIFLLLVLVGILIGVVIMLLQNDGQRRPVELKAGSTITIGSQELEENIGLEAPFIQFKKVASQVTPTVVFIESTIVQERMNMPNDEIHRGRGNQEMWERFLPGRRMSVAGSGVLISQDGYILTNHHVIANADRGRVTVSLQDKRTYRARIIGQDPNTDLAVIKIDDENLPHISIGNSDDVEVGDWVLAVGNPFRLKSTVTAGIVSALGRNVDIINTPMRIESFIQTDAAINRGNSGGALVDVTGNLIGINTAIATETGVYEGYGFAIPINMAVKIARDMIEYGEVKRAYLGVEIQSLSFDSAQNLGLNQASGVLVSRVVKNGSADRAGIQRSDVILEVNGQAVNESHELQARIALLRPGDDVSLRIWSKGQEKLVKVKVVGNEHESVRELLGSNRSDQNPIEIEQQSIHQEQAFDAGFTVTEINNSQDIKAFDLVITKVNRGNKADKAGMQIDDVITQVNGREVNSLTDIRNEYDRVPSGASVRFRIKRKSGSTLFLSIIK